jgi:hypothetical protein
LLFGLFGLAPPSLESLQRFGNVFGDVDLRSDAGVTISPQLASFMAALFEPALARILLLRIERAFAIRFQGSDNSHAREQHRSTVFGGINEHLDSKPPFLTVTLHLGQGPDVIGGASQGLRRRSLGERHRLSERTIPGHGHTPVKVPSRLEAHDTPSGHPALLRSMEPSSRFDSELSR